MLIDIDNDWTLSIVKLKRQVKKSIKNLIETVQKVKNFQTPRQASMEKNYFQV